MVADFEDVVVLQQTRADKFLLDAFFHIAGQQKRGGAETYPQHQRVIVFGLFVGHVVGAGCQHFDRGSTEFERRAPAQMANRNVETLRCRLYVVPFGAILRAPVQSSRG